MSTRMERLFSHTTEQRRLRYGVLLAGVIVVPLVVAGFFAGALTNANQRVSTIPAIVVNNDQLVTATTATGSKQYVLAGRELVTQLTGPNSAGFSWTISNTKQAKAALASGSAYAVLTIPKDFSKSIESISGSSPKRAELNIRTDDAHDYLAGSVAQSVGSAMSSAFGQQITARYLSAFYSSLAGVGASLTTAANGATQVSSGVTGLASGLGALSSGASSAASGAGQLSSGIAAYTNGVDSVSTGLSQASSAASPLAGGATQYTNGVSALSSALAAEVPGLSSSDPATVQKSKDAIAAISTQLAQAAQGGPGLASGVGQLVGGVSQASSGLSQLAAGSSGLRSGATGLAQGVSALSSGTSSSASGATQLAQGASQLATGLTSGAKQASALSGTNASAAAKVVSNPVGVTVTKDNPITSIGAVIGMIFVPIGLWLGALAIFMLLKPLTAVSLACTAPTRKLMFRGLAKAGGLALAQALVLVMLLHAALGVSWSLIPATLAFAMLLALVFTAVHYLFTVAFGRVGIVVSLVLLALQLTSMGGLFPIQILSVPFQVISPLLPLTYAVQGMQGIVSGVGGGAVAGPALVLILFAAASLLISYVLIVRKRGVRAFGFALARG